MPVMKTMNKFILASVLLFGSTGALFADNIIFSENFESQTFPPAKWTIEGTELPAELEEQAYSHWSLNWNEVSGCDIAGSGCAEVMSRYNEGAAGISKEEWLITPEINVIEGASLSFTYWCNASSFILSSKIYGEFLIKVSTDGGDTWTDLWDVASQSDIENSGLTWPWNKDAMGNVTNWQKLTPNINLQAYAGKSVKIAFYF